MYKALLLALALVSLSAEAVQVEDLFRAKVAVDGQGEQARQAAVKTAFTEILIKVTGDADIAQKPEAQALLADANPYLLSFRYGQDEDGLNLYAVFDAKPLTESLWRHGLSFWGAERPQTLIWLVRQDASGRELLTESSLGDQAQLLTATAAARGLPLMLPLGDLDDKLALSTTDIWGRFVEPVADASRRYPASQFVMARLWPSDGQWQLDWQLEGELSLRGRLQAASEAEAMVGLVTQLGQEMAARLAIAGGQDSEPVTLKVTGLYRHQHYLRAMKVLGKLPVVANLSPSLLQGDSITFLVQLRGDEQQLHQALSLSPYFQAQPDGSYLFAVP
ncbi:DUF2066 domain-containing protein [Gallaecimonas sp. GXIMD4217]|uniref:DUF2066 domain-containing protein n=1 Tax=Gallaecimonas sp. GXIMD4217 TaxID=3131927 RepID=UPI00311AC70E